MGSLYRSARCAFVHLVRQRGRIGSGLALGGDVMDANQPFDEGFFGDFYVRKFVHKVGDPYQGHSHFIDHAGQLLSGEVVIYWRDPDGSAGETPMKGPSIVNMPAGRHHRIEAIGGDASWLCWFSYSEAARVHGLEFDRNTFHREA